MIHSLTPCGKTRTTAAATLAFGLLLTCAPTYQRGDAAACLDAAAHQRRRGDAVWSGVVRAGARWRARGVALRLATWRLLGVVPQAARARTHPTPAGQRGESLGAVPRGGVRAGRIRVAVRGSVLGGVCREESAIAKPGADEQRCVRLHLLQSASETPYVPPAHPYLAARDHSTRRARPTRTGPTRAPRARRRRRLLGR